MIKPRSFELNLQDEMKNENRRILCLKADSSFFVFVIQNQKIKKYFVKEFPYEIGDVYVGKVTNILQNLGGAFIAFDSETTGFLPAEKMKYAVPLGCGRKELKCEDLVLVQIKKGPFGEKKPMLTSKLQGFSKEELGDLLDKAMHVYPYTCLYKAKHSFEKYMEKYPLAEGEMIYADSDESNAYLQSVLDPNIDYLYKDERISLYELYGVKRMLHDLQSRKVLLSSGANICIDYTEAFVAVDINSSHFAKGSNKEDAIFQLNCSVIDELLWQIEARNISGVILIDFVNMEDENHKNMLIEQLSKKGAEIHPKLLVHDMTKLGIIECTREKVEENIGKYKALIDKTILI